MQKKTVQSLAMGCLFYSLEKPLGWLIYDADATSPSLSSSLRPLKSGPHALLTFSGTLWRFLIMIQIPVRLFSHKSHGGAADLQFSMAMGDWNSMYKICHFPELFQSSPGLREDSSWKVGEIGQGYRWGPGCQHIVLRAKGERLEKAWLFSLHSIIIDV